MARYKSAAMTKKVRIDDLGGHVGEKVTIEGWLYNKRSSGKLHFLEMRDGSGICQCVVFKGDVSADLFAAADRLTQETSLRLTGVVREHGKQKGQFEIGVAELEVIAAPSREYPISPKEHGVDFLMDNRHLWLRSKRQHAILKVRAEIIGAI